MTRPIEHVPLASDPVGAQSPAAGGPAWRAALERATLREILPLPTAVGTSLLISVSAIFALGSVTGRLSGHSWWRDGIRLLIVAGLAALAAAIIGNILRVE